MDRLAALGGSMRRPAPADYSNNSNATHLPAFSPAHVGASVLFNALGSGSGSDDDTANVDMTDARMDPMAQSTAAAARGASRYGTLSGPAASARSILLQKKLREKKHFDSADYQLAQLKPHVGAEPQAGQSEPPQPTTSSSASPMEIDLTPVIANPVAAASINSPSAASVAVRNRVQAQMSPSVRGGKYGGSALSGANVLVTRKLAEKKRFDSADYHMETTGPAARAAMSKQQSGGSSSPTVTQRFFVSTAVATTTSLPVPPTAAASSAVPAPLAAASSSKYGKLSAANVLIRKKLKERKRFDSADYVLEKQGHQQPPHGGQGGSAGALQGGHVVMDTPMTLNVTSTPEVARPVDALGPGPAAATLSDENRSISHQVKHIKLSEAGGGWAARVSTPVAGSTSSASLATGSAAATTAKASGAKSQDSRLAARNLIIQRKLSERKRFDSADYFKEAASRGPRR